MLTPRPRRSAGSPRAGLLKPRLRKVVSIAGGLLLLALVGWLKGGEQAPSPGGSPSLPSATEAQGRAETPAAGERSREASGGGLRLVIEDVTIENYGKPFYRGDVDLTATVARIRAGESFPHRNDGAVFQNRERRLPGKPRGYYHEYVHPTPRLSGPGPQRIVVGDGGEWYYTPDHYETFLRLDSAGSS